MLSLVEGGARQGSRLVHIHLHVHLPSLFQPVACKQHRRQEPTKLRLIIGGFQTRPTCQNKSHKISAYASIQPSKRQETHCQSSHSSFSSSMSRFSASLSLPDLPRPMPPMPPFTRLYPDLEGIKRPQEEVAMTQMSYQSINIKAIAE